MVQTQKDLELSPKRRSISAPLPQDMASYANNNSEKYIQEKDVKEAILIKTPRPVNPDPFKETGRLST